MATAIDWPTTLPARPTNRGYSELPPETAIHADMDLGPPQSWQRALEGMRHMDVTFEMTVAQSALFDAFFVTTILGGTLSFNIDHPRTLASIEAKILTPPRYSSPGGDNIDVSFRLTQLVS